MSQTTNDEIRALCARTGAPRVRALAHALVVCVAVMFGTASLQAQTLSVSGNPGLLRVSTAVAGSQPNAVSNGSTTYTITTPNPNRTYKLTARLGTPMPAGISITATFAAPPGATSLGAVTLDNTDRDVVINIPRQTSATRGITYQLTATAAGGVVALTPKTVTLTVVRTS